MKDEVGAFLKLFDIYIFFAFVLNRPVEGGTAQSFVSGTRKGCSLVVVT